MCKAMRQYIENFDDDDIRDAFYDRFLGNIDIISEDIFDSVVEVFSRGDLSKIKEIEKIINK